MILYKYYGFEAGIVALKSRRLGFREPKYFNDPFELSYLSNVDASDKDELGSPPVFIENTKEATVILSLTRTPFNPLMWAHYGQDHKGFVVGYNVSDDFLTDEAFNIIPVDQGDVIYTSSKSSIKASIEILRELQLISMGIELTDVTIKNPEQVKSILRKIFLYKHSSWAYEEEVRVVKTLRSPFHTAEDWQSHPKRGSDTLSKDVKPYVSVDISNGLHLYRHKVNIEEVFIGIRNPLLNIDLKEKARDIDRTITDSAEEDGWDIFCMVMNNSSWGLSANKVGAETLSTHEKIQGLLSSFQFNANEAAYLQHVLPQIEISQNDNFEITNWDGEISLKKNSDFINER